MTQEKIGAVVTGGDHQGLGAVRTLARKGIPIVLTDHDHCIGRYSRYCGRFFRSPHPSDADAYVRFLIELADRENLRGWVVFANNDDIVYALSKYKSILEKYYRVTTDSWDVIQYVHIKELTYRIAQEHDIPIPATYFPRDLDDLMQMDLQFPVVMKPSIRDHFYNTTKIKAFRINSREELPDTYKRMCSVVDRSEILVQDFIPGAAKQLYSFCTFSKGGKTIASIMARRTRQHPKEFGTSTFAEIVDIPEVQATAERFLRTIRFNGIAEVEFMLDPRDDTYKLIEVNPRIWGFHTLAIAAGADLPYLAYQDMIGEELHVTTPAKTMKWVRMSTDIPTAALEIINGRMSIGKWIASLRGRKQFSVWALDDPMPCIAEFIMLLYLYAKRGF